MERLDRAHRRVLRRGSRITDASPAEDLHDLRKRAKELRYLLETFPPTTDPADARVAIKELKALQDVLGTFQDSEAQREALYSFATDMMAADGASARTIFAMGEIAARLQEDQDTSRAQFAAMFERFSRRSAQRRTAHAGTAPYGAGGAGHRNGRSGAVKVVATYNIKGGVGKTSTAVNIAYFAARDGLRTLLWDLDPQGSATYLFRVKPKVKGGGNALVRGKRTLDDGIKGTDFDRLDLMPADFSYRNLDLDLDSTKRPTDRIRRLLAPLKKEYDLVVLDCPPSVSLVSENVVHACDVLLVPLIPAMLSVRTYDQLIDFVDTMPGRKPQVMGFLSMVDRRKKAHREFTERLPNDHASVVPEAIPSRVVIEQMADERAPVPAFAPASSATAAYEALWARVQSRLNGTG